MFQAVRNQLDEELEAETLKQCEGCYYWRGLSGTWGGGDKACHYLIDNGQSRKRDGDKCLSRREAEIHKKRTNGKAKPWPMPDTTGSTLDGYKKSNPPTGM
jgi:hypothetical protein